MQSYDGDPDKFVDQNRETLVRILKHGDDEFVRALALAAILEYGSDSDIEDIERQLQRVRDENGGVA